MRNDSQGREKMNGQVGRTRRYCCRNCEAMFSRFLLRSLPERARLCNKCLEQPELKRQYDEAFEERDGKEEGNAS